MVNAVLTKFPELQKKANTVCERKTASINSKSEAEKKR